MALERVEAGDPVAPVGLEPGVELEKRLRPKLVKAPLRVGVRFNEAGLLEHPQVLRDLRLAEPQSRSYLPDRTGSASEEIHDAEPVGLGEGRQRRDHAFIFSYWHIPVKACTPS